MSSFVSLEDAEVTTDLRVCCRELAQDVKDKKIKVVPGRFRKKSTIDGGPGYFEVYVATIADLEDNEIKQCGYCEKSLVGGLTRLTIKYMEKK